MDTFFTVITWIVGIYAGFILLMAIGFSAGGAAQTGKSELGLASTFSTLLLFYLIWKGVSSLFFSDTVDESRTVRTVKVAVVDTQTPSVQVSAIMAPSTNHAKSMKVKPEAKVETIAPKKDVSNDINWLLWAFYIVTFIAYFSWIFAPSKTKGEGKDLIKQKFIASMTFKEDESGLKPWNPNWKPETNKD